MTKYNKGDVVSGKVTGIEPYGIFVLIDNEVAGLIHISEVSSSFVRDISDYAEIGETIRAKVLDIDTEENRLKLTIKDFEYRDGAKAKRGIHETKSGFENLKKALDYWVQEKEDEMSKNEKKEQ